MVENFQALAVQGLARMNMFIGKGPSFIGWSELNRYLFVKNGFIKETLNKETRSFLEYYEGEKWHSNVLMYLNVITNI